MKFYHKITVFLVLLTSVAYGQITGLSGWNIFLDPGHSRTENMGIFNYSEAEKNLGVALELRDLLNNTTDIDTVYMSRTNSGQLVSLGQRTDHANSVGAAWYHSIHSDAGASTSNSTLLLWGELDNGQPDPPIGGEEMSEYMVDLLTRGMRISTRGSIGDCSFYTWSDWCETSGGPYLHVNRVTTMPSELSEAGFHTNPTQNQRNMNAEWKRMEAYTFYWSILKYNNITRPTVDIAMGYISDTESGEYINGATVSIDGKSYTTDTYQSLFHQYSSDPDQLRNGFYFIENVSPGTHEMTISAEGYYSDTVFVSMVDTFFTSEDVSLLSSVPPSVVETAPEEGANDYPAWDPIRIDFSRSMDRPSTEAAFSISPDAAGSFNWAQNDTRLYFWPDEDLQYETDYTVTIAGTATDAYGHQFDGNADSTGGDPFTLHFTTGPEDMEGPVATSIYPGGWATGIELQPIISITFNEKIDPTSIDSNTVQLSPMSSEYLVPGEILQYDFPERSILTFFPEENLESEIYYMVTLNPGYTDLLGNEMELYKTTRFKTGSTDWQFNIIDNFNGGVTNWWNPDQSYHTNGIIPDTTFRSLNSDFVNLSTNSINSLQISFGWDTLNSNNWMIREYLGSGPPRNVTFDDSYKLQVYIFGDGSGTQFRFAVDDNNLSGTSQDHEVSPWYTIDWYGWRLVSWNMSEDGTGEWLGDGNLDGTMRFDSIQLTRTSSSAQFGTLYFDDLRLATDVEVGIETPSLSTVPNEYQLKQNYPNPFNPTTKIEYTLPNDSKVRLTVFNLRGEIVRSLVAGYQSAGYHTVEFDASEMPSGVYLYRLESPEFTSTKKMSVVK
ncbi:MAG: Sporulation-specific N-acetylmuramoyl-L-alanine amidase [Candidatus Marinimicrobia bacterium]|nr:Sporulation-specific N-acetylmuramoyl-L-alanine amidase [Candidatus Neomarinimicrobiota bacterium]